MGQSHGRTKRKQIPMEVRVAYQNVGGGNKGQHAWLEFCKQKEMDIIFVGEVFVPRDGYGRIKMAGYELATEVKKGTKVAAYWRTEIGNQARIILDQEDAIGFECGKTRIVGVYGRGKSNTREYGQWVERVVGKLRNKDGILIGDWNAHHTTWSEKGKEDGKGRSLEQAISGIGGRWKATKGHTWERKVGQDLRMSRIDLIFEKGQVTQGKIQSRKISSDHWGIWTTMKMEMEVDEIRRQAIDWKAIEKTLQKDKKPEERDEKWYDTLRGTTAYDKLLQFKERHMKEVRVSSQSKRWWDEELTTQLKATRKARRGGKKRKQSQQEHFRNWRAASLKLKHMIGQKKQKCWQKFCEEHGHRDPWEIVRWAKDPW